MLQCCCCCCGGRCNSHTCDGSCSRRPYCCCDHHSCRTTSAAITRCTRRLAVMLPAAACPRGWASRTASAGVLTSSAAADVWCYSAGAAAAITQGSQAAHSSSKNSRTPRFNGHRQAIDRSQEGDRGVPPPPPPHQQKQLRRSLDGHRQAINRSHRDHRGVPLPWVCQL